MWPALLAPSRFGGLLLGILLPLTGNAAQSLDAARSAFQHGRYDDALQTAQRAVQANERPREEWRVLLIQSLLTTGRYREAFTNAQQALQAYSAGIRVHLLARETCFYQDNPPGAQQELEDIKSLIERRFRAYQSDEDLVPLGQALLLLGVEPRLVLENCFQRAEKLDAPPREAFLATGQLALDKHDFAMAADAFRAGLKHFPDDPDLNAGLARAFKSGNRQEMLSILQAALAVNPRHIPSLLLLVDHLIDAEQYEEAGKQLDIVLEVNPHQPQALAYRAVLAALANDSAAEKQYRAHALQFYSANPEVDFLIGLKLSQKYRFQEGAACQRRALELQTDYLPAKRQLAEDLLRLGQAEEGWRLAQEVHDQDPYDVAAYNLVTLHDQMAKFSALTNADFLVHMAPLEAALYGDRVLDLLSRARTNLCAKYGVELSRLTTVEIYPEQKDFAVRTFGMPDNPGYLGVCFGSVITANSPASQAPNPANWEDVLWHEFCHVVTLTATHNRMPRWFSEGISVYEERQANPAWGEHMNLAYRDLIQRGELVPLANLSGAFLTPKDSLHLQFAYYESSLVVEWIVQRYGMDTLKRILADLRDGQELNRSLAARTVALPDLEKQFAAYVRSKADQLAPGADLDKPPAGESEMGRALWEKSHPNNYYLALENAQELMKSNLWSAARTALQSLAASYAGEKGSDNPLWLLAITNQRLGDTNAELSALRTFAKIELDYAPLYLRLIQLSASRSDWPAVNEWAERLLAINPLIPAPYQALAESGVALGKNDQAIEAYRCLLRLDPADPVEVHFQLAGLLHARGDSEDAARRQVLQALEDAPRFVKAQQLLLEIERGQPTAQEKPKSADSADRLQ